MSKLRALDKNLSLTDKRVILRVDLNVPINEGKIIDRSRINKIIPTIKDLINKKAKVILISHLGRPGGKIDQKLSLKPLVSILKSLLNTEVHFSNENYSLNIIEKSKKLGSGEVLLLENIRFNKEEELNTKSFAKDLSKIGDLYINEAFSCSHRAHASVCEITKYIDSYAGKFLLEEVNAIKMLTEEAKKPVTCIIGGSKISSKINLLTNLIKKMENIIIVGAMANGFIKQKGFNIGKSFNEKNQDNLIQNVLNESKKNKCDIL